MSSLFNFCVLIILWLIEVKTPLTGSRWHKKLPINSLMLCTSTSFWVLRTPKSLSKHFFQPFFKLFCSFQSFFSKKSTEKRQFRGTPSGSQPALRSRKNHFFCSFSDIFCWFWLVLRQEAKSLVGLTGRHNYCITLGNW